MAWEYDSYCTQDVKDYYDSLKYRIKFKRNKNIFDYVEKEMMDYYLHEISQVDHELIIGVSIYAIRNGHKFTEDFLRNLRTILDYIIEYGNFDDWKEKDKKVDKLIKERLIIANLIRKRELKFGKIIDFKEEFDNLKIVYKYFSLIHQLGLMEYHPNQSNLYY